MDEISKLQKTIKAEPGLEVSLEIFRNEKDSIDEMELDDDE